MLYLEKSAQISINSCPTRPNKFDHNSKDAVMKLTFYILFILGPLEGPLRIKGDISIPKVLAFYRTRHIGSVNVHLCGWDGIPEGTKFGFYDGFLTNFRLSESTNATSIRTTFDLQHHRVGVLLNLSCQSSWDLLQKASENSLLNTSYVYTLISSYPEESVFSRLEPLKIQFDTDLTLFAGHNIYEIYRTGVEKPITAVPCGKYSDEGGIMSYSKPPRWDLDGVTINAATVVKGAILKEGGMERYLDHTYQTEVDALSRFPLVAHQLVEYLCNFKTNLMIVPDWGYLQPETGHFDPGTMFGWMEEGKIDLGLTLSSVNPTRLAIASYTRSTFKLKSSAVFKHPAVGASYVGFARPFSFRTWLALGVFVFLASLVLSLIQWRDVEDDPPNEPGFTVSLLYVLAIISLQGSYIKSIRLPSRVLSVSLHIFGLLLYSYYGAIVVGFLLSPAPRTITTVEKLIDSGMDMWVENVSFHRNHFEWNISSKATFFYEKAIRGETKEKDKFLDRKIALKMVQKGGVAVYGQNIEMYKVIQSTFSGPEICSLHYILMVDVQLAVTTSKNSPYREIYKKAVLRFIESGFLDVQQKRWHSQRPACFGSESTNPVKLEATSIAQFIFVGGFFLAIVILILEISFRNILKISNKKSSLIPRNML